MTTSVTNCSPGLVQGHPNTTSLSNFLITCHFQCQLSSTNPLIADSITNEVIPIPLLLAARASDTRISMEHDHPQTNSWTSRLAGVLTAVVEEGPFGGRLLLAAMARVVSDLKQARICV